MQTRDAPVCAALDVVRLSLVPESILVILCLLFIDSLVFCRQILPQVANLLEYLSGLELGLVRLDRLAPLLAKEHWATQGRERGEGLEALAATEKDGEIIRGRRRERETEKEREKA